MAPADHAVDGAPRQLPLRAFRDAGPKRGRPRPMRPHRASLHGEELVADCAAMRLLAPKYRVPDQSRNRIRHTTTPRVGVLRKREHLRPDHVLDCRSQIVFMKKGDVNVCVHELCHSCLSLLLLIISQTKSETTRELIPKHWGRIIRHRELRIVRQRLLEQGFDVFLTGLEPVMARPFNWPCSSKNKQEVPKRLLEAPLAAEQAHTIFPWPVDPPTKVGEVEEDAVHCVHVSHQLPDVIRILIFCTFSNK